MTIQYKGTPVCQTGWSGTVDQQRWLASSRPSRWPKSIWQTAHYMSLIAAAMNYFAGNTNKSTGCVMHRIWPSGNTVTASRRTAWLPPN